MKKNQSISYPHHVGRDASKDIDRRPGWRKMIYKAQAVTDVSVNAPIRQGKEPFSQRFFAVSNRDTAPIGDINQSLFSWQKPGKGKENMRKNITTNAQNAQENTTAATMTAEATKTTTNTKKEEGKNMENKKNTTTNSTSTKTTKAEPLTMETAEKENKLFFENGTALLFVPRLEKGVDGWSVNASAKRYKMPKTLKADKAMDAIKMVERAILTAITNQTAEKIASLKKAIDKQNGIPTEAQELQSKQYAALLTLVDKCKTNYSLRSRNTIPDNMSVLLAADITNSRLAVECGPLKSALVDISKTLDNVLDAFLSGQSVKITPEQQTEVTSVKKTVARVLNPYTDETENWNAFVLKVGNKDVASWYKLGFSKFGESCQWNRENTANLEKSLVKFLLYKIGADSAENPNA